MGVSKAEGIPVSCGDMPCRCTIRLVVQLYAMLGLAVPYRLALWLSFGLWCRLVAGLSLGCWLLLGCWVVIWLLLSFGYWVVVWPAFGSSCCCLGHCCWHWVKKWSVGLRSEGGKTHYLGLPFVGSPLCSTPSPPSTGPHPSRKGRGT